MDMVLVIIAGILTLAGLGLYLYGNVYKAKYFFAYNVISWLFIPVFPLVFILLAFPGSMTEGQLFNFKVTGAFASYVLLWFFGIKLTKKGVEIDALKSEIVKLQEKCTYVDVMNKTSAGEKPKVINETGIKSYKLKQVKGKSIAIITGDIANVKDIDIWVNSENTNMQMARFGEDSISSTIRYLGAKKQPPSMMVAEDTIAKHLQEKLGNITMVAPATVIVTDSGELRERNRVKKIFHVASVDGQPASGYKPIIRIQDCVTNCLEKADDRNEFPKEKFASILFGLMGTGRGGGNLDDITERLIKTAINYLEQKKGSTTIDTVYFLAYTDRDLAACKKVLLESEKVEIVQE